MHHQIRREVHHPEQTDYWDEEVSIDVTYSVKKGDKIVFGINQEGNNSFDGGKLSITIALVETTAQEEGIMLMDTDAEEADKTVSNGNEADVAVSNENKSDTAADPEDAPDEATGSENGTEADETVNGGDEDTDVSSGDAMDTDANGGNEADEAADSGNLTKANKAVSNTKNPEENEGTEEAPEGTTVGIKSKKVLWVTISEQSVGKGEALIKRYCFQGYR